VSSVVTRADRWLSEPAPPERLGMFRLLAGGFAVGYLLVRAPAFWSLADRSPARFEPVGVLAWLDEPLSSRLWHTIFVFTVLVGVAFTVGVAFRASGPVFALGVLLVTTYRSSFGQLLYFENLLVLHLLIIGVSRSADALRLGGSGFTRSVRGPPSSAAYGWPMRLAAIVTVVTYVLAGVAKLRFGGISWLTGDTLRNHIAFSAARLGLLGGHYSPLAEVVVANSWLLTPAAALVVVWELGAPVALLGGRVATAWVAGIWLMHVSIAATMFVVFPYPISLIAFAPFFRIERLVVRHRAWSGTV
jgi:hypothetical protein